MSRGVRDDIEKMRAREKGREVECSTCHGFGRIGDGPFSAGAECHDCDGKGITK